MTQCNFSTGKNSKKTPQNQTGDLDTYPVCGSGVCVCRRVKQTLITQETTQYAVTLSIHDIK